MEDLPSHEQSKTREITQRLAGSFIAGIRFVGRQLAASDQNPHEGRLRGSIIPAEYIHIPDTPPSYDGTM